MPGRPLRVFAAPLALVSVLVLVIGRVAAGAVGLCLVALMVWVSWRLDRRFAERR